jgi:hypothetical protein
MLAGGRPTLFALSDNQKVFASTKTSIDENAAWSRWTEFSPLHGKEVKSVAASQQKNHRLRVWYIDNNNSKIFSAEQTKAEWNAPYGEWAEWPLPAQGVTADLLSATPLHNGSAQVFCVDSSNIAWTNHQKYHDTEGGWAYGKSWGKLYE